MAKDAYRSSLCRPSEEQVLVEEVESRALCWFITLLGLVTEIRTGMFQSDSWPLRFTHRSTNTPTAATVFQTHTCTCAHMRTNTGEQTPTPSHAQPQKILKRLHTNKRKPHKQTRYPVERMLSCTCICTEGSTHIHTNKKIQNIHGNTSWDLETKVKCNCTWNLFCQRNYHNPIRTLTIYI